MNGIEPRLGGAKRGIRPDGPLLCDAATVEGRRGTLVLDEDTRHRLVGKWPNDLEIEPVRRLVDLLGDPPSWHQMVSIPPVTQRLGERSQLQPLEREILRDLHHLQHVCHRPRLYLRVVDERVPISRARRWPSRAVADLLSRPGDWEHRSLRSVQPRRILARQVEDDWDLYENRVAARLVDHLLNYLSRRLEELHRIEALFQSKRDHGDQARSSHWRTKRVMKLWADALTMKTEEGLRETIRAVDGTYQRLQALLDSPLYRAIPRRASVPLNLRTTNLLRNDVHYRRVASLWRKWLEFGHTRDETRKERIERQTRVAAAWDRFVLHLVVRTLHNLGWKAEEAEGGWELLQEGHPRAELRMDDRGVIRLRLDEDVLSLLPICSELSSADPAQVTALLDDWDALAEEIVVVHVGQPIDLDPPERAAGWSFGGHTTLFACSPWGIDSEERMTRLIGVWLQHHYKRPYPLHRRVHELPEIPSEWRWLHHQEGHLLALRAPDPGDQEQARRWAERKLREITLENRRAEQARRAPRLAPLNALTVLQDLIETASQKLARLGVCPVCHSDKARVEPRPGRAADGSDATWWESCPDCGSQWGLLRCPHCGSRFHALLPHTGIDLLRFARSTPPVDWPDRIIGRDVWALPWPDEKENWHFVCPECGFYPGQEAPGVPRPPHQKQQ